MGLITKKEAAGILAVSERTVDRYVALGRLAKLKAREGDAQRAPVRFEEDEVRALFVEINDADRSEIEPEELESCGQDYRR